MRDDLVEGEIDLLVRENEIKVVLQGHLPGPRFHFRVHPLFALKLHFQFLLFLFGGFWFWLWEDSLWLYIYIYEFEIEKSQWDHGYVGWERATRKWRSQVRPWLCRLRESYEKVIFIFMFKKQAGGLKFEIEVSPKAFETGQELLKTAG